MESKISDKVVSAIIIRAIILPSTISLFLCLSRSNQHENLIFSAEPQERFWRLWDQGGIHEFLLRGRVHPFL